MENKQVNENQKYKKITYYYFKLLKLLNSIIFSVLLITLIAVIWQVYLFSTEVRKFLSDNQEKISKTLTNIENASKALEESFIAVKQASEAQNKILTDKKTLEGIGLLLRQGNDIALTIDKVNSALDKVNKEVLPNVNNALKTTDQTIAQAGATLREGETSIRILTAKGVVVIDSTNSSIRALEAILAQPNLKVIVDNLTQSSAASIETVKELNLSAKEINKALPELVEKIKVIGDNTDLSGKEITKFLQGLNKPQTKKQRLSKFLLETIIKSSPVLLKR